MKFTYLRQLAGLSLLGFVLAFSGCEPVPYAEPDGPDPSVMEEDGVDVDVNAGKDGAQVDVDADADRTPADRPLEGLDVDVNAGDNGVDVDVEKKNPS